MYKFADKIMSLIFTLIFVLWWAKENSEYADWLAGIGTVGSLAFLAYQYSKDRKDKLNLEKKQQASKIAIYYELKGSSNNRQHYIVISNASDLPVYSGIPFMTSRGTNLHLPFIYSLGPGSAISSPRLKYLDKDYGICLTIIPPGKSYYLTDFTALSKFFLLEMGYQALADSIESDDSVDDIKGLASDLLYGLRFRDSYGQTWTRNSNGQLTAHAIKLTVTPSSFSSVEASERE